MEFSIIVPVYNTEKNLPQCIESIQSQKFKDFEAILVDDGSTDNCPQICDKYATIDERIKVIHKKNEGVTSARKSGSEIAVGNYITLVDSDDMITDDFLFVMNEIIDQYKPDVIAGGWRTVKGIGDTGIKKEVKGFEIGMYNKDRINMTIIPALFGNGGTAILAL